MHLPARTLLPMTTNIAEPVMAISRRAHALASDMSRITFARSQASVLVSVQP